MTSVDLKVIGGQPTLGGIFELFYPKWGWVNGGSSCGPPLPTYLRGVRSKTSRPGLWVYCVGFKEN